MLRIIAVLLSLVTVTAIKIDKRPRATAPQLGALTLRGGGALGTPLSPLELTEASMGAIYWVQIALLPQVCLPARGMARRTSHPPHACVEPHSCTAGASHPSHATPPVS